MTEELKEPPVKFDDMKFGDIFRHQGKLGVVTSVLQGHEVKITWDGGPCNKMYRGDEWVFMTDLVSRVSDD
jgi:hypothetical protein